MPSATDFLPSSMTEFMNFDRTMSPKRGSGRISRFSGRRRRDIGLFLSLQPYPEPVRGLLVQLLRTLGAVLRTGLPAVLDTLGVENAAQNVIADTRKVAHTAATDQHDAVLLKVVALARDVADDFALVRQANLGDLAKRRVRLLRGRRVNAGANAALLRVLFHRRDLGLGLLRLATLADQLVNRWHEALHLYVAGRPGGYFAQSKSVNTWQLTPPGLHVVEQCSALSVRGTRTQPRGRAAT